MLIIKLIFFWDILLRFYFYLNAYLDGTSLLQMALLQLCAPAVRLPPPSRDHSHFWPHFSSGSVPYLTEAAAGQVPSWEGQDATREEAALTEPLPKVCTVLVWCVRVGGCMLVKNQSQFLQVEVDEDENMFLYNKYWVTSGGLKEWKLKA